MANRRRNSRGQFVRGGGSSRRKPGRKPAHASRGMKGLGSVYAIKRTGISFVRYPEPIDWNGKPAEFVVGIAGAGKDHMALLTKIAGVFLNKDEVARLRQASTPEEVREVLGNTGK